MLPWKRILHWWTVRRKNVFLCRSNALIPCSFCDNKINIYNYWLSRLWLYHYFEYVDCNMMLALVSLASLHPFNAHIWKSSSPKSLFVDKYENDTHAHCRLMMLRGKPYFRLIMTISWSTCTANSWYCKEGVVRTELEESTWRIKIRYLSIEFYHVNTNIFVIFSVKIEMFN